MKIPRNLDPDIEELIISIILIVAVAVGFLILFTAGMETPA